jgi:glyoxylase-like metal-dependent hydrolase (beta-lactamase superfamily II)
MRVLSRTGGVAATTAYVLADAEAKTCVVVDAPDHTLASLLAKVRQNDWKIEALWLTHGHFDHIADHALLADVPLVMHAADVPKLQNPQAMLDAFAERSGFQVPLDISPREPDRLVEDGDELTVGNLRCRILHTPGHSPGHVAYHFEAERILVSGDLILSHSIGRTDLPGCDEGEMIASLRRVMALPDDTRLLPGHGEPSTVGEEREHNHVISQLPDAS